MTIDQAIQPSGGDWLSTTELSESERYRLLANHCRRRTLEVLDDVDAPLTLDALAARVADTGHRAETDGGEAETPGEDQHVAIALHHVHLPMLAAADVVSYDTETRTVDPTV